MTLGLSLCSLPCSTKNAGFHDQDFMSLFVFHPIQYFFIISYLAINACMQTILYKIQAPQNPNYCPSVFHLKIRLQLRILMSCNEHPDSQIYVYHTSTWKGYYGYYKNSTSINKDSFQISIICINCKACLCQSLKKSYLAFSNTLTF